MTRISKFEPGQFSWIDLMSPDAAVSKRFYESLFDWGSTDNPTDQGGVYTQFRCEEELVAGLGEIMNSGILENPGFQKVTPALLQDWYREPEAQWFRTELLDAEGLTSQLFYRIYRTGIVGRGMRALSYLQDREYPIMLGSDTPGSPSYVNQPGLNTYHDDGRGGSLLGRHI